MGIFNRQRKDGRTRRPLKIIQAASVEGVTQPVKIDNLLTGVPINISVPGTSNAYKNYDAQVAETYRKYNSESDFGNAQTRATIDLRTALIAGEGLSISAQNDVTGDWIDDFLTLNDFKGQAFINAVKGSEIAGQALMALKAGIDKRTNEIIAKIIRLPYYINKPYKVVYTDPIVKDEISHIMIKTEGVWQRLAIDKFVYLRTGGDDANSRGPITKVGTVLTDIENYDRAVRDIRRINHILARITPVFETKTAQETTSVANWIGKVKWKIGEAFIGTAKFSYQTVETGAHDNLKTELITAIKNIASATGVPVHWLGYVDLMSNRSTAESLYELIKHATILERLTWETNMRELILLGQEVFIDAGGIGLSFDDEFEVKLPLIDFSNFFEKVKALSLAFSDNAISMGDYRNQLPTIDPLKTKKAVDEEEEENINNLIKIGIPNISKDEGEEEDE